MIHRKGGDPPAAAEDVSPAKVKGDDVQASTSTIARHSGDMSFSEPLFPHLFPVDDVP